MTHASSPLRAGCREICIIRQNPPAQFIVRLEPFWIRLFWWEPRLSVHFKVNWLKINLSRNICNNRGNNNWRIRLQLAELLESAKTAPSNASGPESYAGPRD